MSKAQSIVDSLEREDVEDRFAMLMGAWNHGASPRPE